MELKTILLAYGYEKAKEAFIEMHKEFIENRRLFKTESAAREAIILSGQDGWSEWKNKDYGDNAPKPEGHEWFVLDGKLYTRPIPGFRGKGQIIIETSEDVVTEKQKTDLSMQQTDKACIYCGGALAWEPICPGCRLGKLGFRGRFVCMDDMDHEFYVLREGVVLPNQGDMPDVN